jgi:hypothetical protein
MTYGEIVTAITNTIYGDTTAPVSVGTRLRGSNGIIARKRKQLTEQENLWFMENLRQIYVAQGVTEYTLNFDFKQEIGLRLSDPYTGDYWQPLKRISRDQIDSVFIDYDQTASVPWKYYIDFGTSYRILNLFPKPSRFNDTVELSVNAEQFTTSDFKYVIDGTQYESTSSDNSFTFADTINTGADAGTFWGVWLVQINSSGTISTKSGGGLDDQVYTSESLAINALPQVDSGNWPVGYITVESNTGASWTANTDDLVEGSDCTSANFYNITSLLYVRYWEFLDDLSDTAETFNATEDQVSIECSDFLIWSCISELCITLRDWELKQVADNEVGKEYAKIIEKDFQYKKVNKKIPYGGV